MEVEQEPAGQVSSKDPLSHVTCAERASRERVKNQDENVWEMEMKCSCQTDENICVLMLSDSQNGSGGANGA